jgi:hypothetical protein
MDCQFGWGEVKVHAGNKGCLKGYPLSMDMLRTFMDVMAFNNEPNVPLKEENKDCTKEVHG